MESQVQNLKSYIYIYGKFHEVDLTLEDMEQDKCKCRFINTLRRIMYEHTDLDPCGMSLRFIKKVEGKNWTLYKYYISADPEYEYAYVVFSNNDDLSEIKKIIDSDNKHEKPEQVPESEPAKAYAYIPGCTLREINLTQEDLKPGCECVLTREVWRLLHDCYGDDFCGLELKPIWRYETPQGAVVKYRATTEIGSHDDIYFIFGPRSLEDARRMLAVSYTHLTLPTSDLV